MATVRSGEVNIMIESNPIEVTSMGPRPDEKWRFTDTEGHEHFYADGYPTLRHVVDSEDWMDEDGEEYPGDSHLECVRCGEVIVPGMKGPSTAREYIAGPSSAKVSIGHGPSFPISPAQLAELRALSQLPDAQEWMRAKARSFIPDP